MREEDCKIFWSLQILQALDNIELACWNILKIISIRFYTLLSFFSRFYAAKLWEVEPNYNVYTIRVVKWKKKWKGEKVGRMVKDKSIMVCPKTLS